MALEASLMEDAVVLHSHWELGFSQRAANGEVVNDTQLSTLEEAALSRCHY